MKTIVLLLGMICTFAAKAQSDAFAAIGVHLTPTAPQVSLQISKEINADGVILPARVQYNFAPGSDAFQIQFGIGLSLTRRLDLIGYPMYHSKGLFVDSHDHLMALCLRYTIPTDRPIQFEFAPVYNIETREKYPMFRLTAQLTKIKI